MSKYTLHKELKTYGDGYYIIWPCYSSMNVDQITEMYLFDFDSALVALGSSLGLYLGLSGYSIVMIFIEFCLAKFRNNNNVSRVVHKWGWV